MEASDILLGIVGKTNVGKSTFFSAVTEVQVDIDNRPFVTIEPNIGVAYATKRCAHVDLGLEGCDASNSLCIGGLRYIPVRVMDVAGLVPGAHRGRGLGNKFLDNLRRADALLLVVDASGSTDEEGVPAKPGFYDPVEEARSMMAEIDEWVYSIIRRDWEKFSRQVDAGSPDPVGALAARLSGLSIRRAHVAGALEATGLEGKRLSAWRDEEIREFVVELRRRSKPIVIVANKTDVPGSEENVKRLREHLRDYPVVPVSSLAELALRRLSRRGLIEYTPGDREYRVLKELGGEDGRLLKAISRLVLERWGTTGAQEAINKAVFEVLGRIAVYPVDDVNRYSDKSGRVLPDVLLVERGTTARQLAYKIHTDLGESFLHGINARTGQRVGEGYALRDGDVIKIVAVKSRS